MNSSRLVRGLISEMMQSHNLVKMDDFDVEENSKVLMFRYFKSDRRNHVYILFAIEYKDDYDVVLREIKDKDKYFFSYDDYDGYTYDLIYRKL